jgi:hypothetical protein
MLVLPMSLMPMLCNALSMLMIYVIKVARYACGDDAHMLTNQCWCCITRFLLFVSKHKDFMVKNRKVRVISVETSMLENLGDRHFLDKGN